MWWSNNQVLSNWLVTGKGIFDQLASHRVTLRQSDQVGQSDQVSKSDQVGQSDKVNQSDQLLAQLYNMVFWDGKKKQVLSN